MGHYFKDRSDIVKLLILVCCGGAIGAGLRHILNNILLRQDMLNWPWATFLANVLGSLSMGVLSACIFYRMPQAVALKAFFATGILGGFTTFSAFSMESLLLFERGHAALALLYILASVALSIGACALGYLGVRALVL